MNKKYSYVGVAFVILLFGIYVVRNIESRFEKSDLYTFEKVPAFEFVNQEGNKINNQTYAGKVYVVEFFFSTCPTICPLMTKKMLLLQDEFLETQISELRPYQLLQISILQKFSKPMQERMRFPTEIGIC